MTGRPQPVFLVSSTGQLGCFDTVTSNTCTIDTEHHEIHEGDHYTAQHLFTNIDSTSVYLLITAPDTSARIHFVFSCAASLNGTVYLFENPTLGGAGTPITPINNDRNSGNTTTAVVQYSPTVNADGTQLLVNVIGTDGATPVGGNGGIILRTNEIILKQNEDYLVKFTALNDDTRCNICMEFYEE